MLRQCHLFYTPHGSNHLITRKDVLCDSNSLAITVRTSKTTGARNVTIINVSSVPGSHSCPVLAYQRAIRLSPRGPHDVLFLDPHSKQPFSAARANLMLRAGLASVGFKGASVASFHSLRRSSAQVCARAGVPLEEVRRHGMWRSSGIRSYLPSHSSGTSKAISDSMSSSN